MYIDSISLERFRTFRKCRIDFLHPDQEFGKLDLPTPRLPNINLLLGNNGLGKTTLLKAVALAALGPAVADSGIYPHRLIRREPEAVARKSKVQPEQNEAVLDARFTLHEQDHAGPHEKVESRVTIARKGDLEQLRWTPLKRSSGIRSTAQARMRSFSWATAPRVASNARSDSTSPHARARHSCARSASRAYSKRPTR